MFSLRLLGGAAIEGERGPLRGRAGQARRVGLLALAATSPTRSVSRDKLVAYLWPESGAEQGRHLLSESLYVLRKALGAEALITDGDNVRLNSDVVASDVEAFEKALEEGDLERAVSHYRGPFLDGFFLKDAPEFERWVDSERARLADRYAAAVELLGEGAETSQDWATAVSRWKQLAAHDPYNSRVALRLMQAMVSAGDPANALQHARDHERLLREELGVEPAPDVVALAERIRREPPPSRAVEGPEPLAEPAAAEVELERAPRPGPRLRLWHVLLPGAAVCAVVAMAWYLASRGDGPAGPAGEAVSANRIAVFPFSYSGREELAYLSEGMVDLLSATLDGFGQLRTLDRQAVMGLVVQEGGEAPDRTRAGAIAQRLGAGRFVLGSVVEAGGRLRVGARLYGPGVDVESEQTVVQGEVGQLFELIDDLSAQLLLIAAGDEDGRFPRVAVLTSDSLPALKAYLEGEAHFRAGRILEAVPAFQSAVEIDSSFAAAWQALSRVFSFGPSYWDQAIEATERAIRHGERLPPRQRQILEATLAHLRGAGHEAELGFWKVLEDYPLDIEAFSGLASLLHDFNPLRGRSRAEARGYYERVLRYLPEDWEAAYGLTLLEAAEGNWSRVDSLMPIWADGDPPIEWRATLAFATGDPAAQDRVLAEANEAVLARVRLALAHVYFASQYVGWMAGDLQGALRLARVVERRAESPQMRALGHLQVARLELSQGRWRAGQAELARVAALMPLWAVDHRALWATAEFLPVTGRELRALRDTLARSAAEIISPELLLGEYPAGYVASIHNEVRPHLRLYLMGRLSGRLGEDDAALRYAEEVERLEPPAASATLSRDLARAIRAQVHLARGRAAQALEVLAGPPPEVRTPWLYFVPFYSRAEERFLRGEILAELERYEGALAWYGTVGAYGDDIVYVAPSHLRRAEIYELLGERENAALHYARFVELWKDCDTELRPMVRHAEDRLASLVGETETR